ncbi:nicotinamide mononucleotide transporter [Mycoplasma sp. VS292A]|uniref:nicotinamide mononucleotide transporter n=1 Tax=Mycoplasma sp. VS292A TaxID=3401680 RepID=UPI003AB07DBB
MVSGLSGILATYLFYRRIIYAYPIAILNAIAYGIFAWSLDLFIDVIIYSLILPAIFIYFWIVTSFKFKIRSYKLELRWILILALVFIIMFIVFYFSTKGITKFLQVSFKKEIIEFGSNFKYKNEGYVLVTLTNTILIIAVVMMLRGFSEVWLIWQIKNILSIVFYSGIALTNLSVVIINICYMCLSIYIFIRSSQMKKVYIAITGPGCVGKSTALNSEQFSKLIEDNKFYMFQERDYKSNDNDYILALKGKKSFWQSQKFFFKTQQDDIEKGMLMDQNIIFDRHMLDSFIYPEVQIKNALYTEKEIKQWRSLKRKMLNFLKQKPKLDLLIIVTSSSFDKIEQYRYEAAKADNRRALENALMPLYRQYWEYYNTASFKEFLNGFCKNLIYIYNDGTKEELSYKIIKTINDYLEKNKNI